VRRATDPVHGLTLLTLQEDAAAVVSFGPPALTSGSPVVAVRPLADVLVTQLLPAPGTEASLAARLAWSPLAPGTSVIDLDGRLVAFFAAGVAGGLPLVATDLEQRLLPPLREGLTPANAWLGADLQAVDASLAARVGQGLAVVAFVEPESPAARAGLRPRDVVVGATAQGQPLTAFDMLPARLQPGTVIELDVRRGTEARRVRVTLGQRAYPAGVSAVTGIAVDGGAPVLRIAPASPLAGAGLRTGDAVEQVDGQAVDATGLERVLRRGRSLLLTVRREGRRLLVVVPAAETVAS
jgi:S1-C subfamily serine protease